MSAILAATLAVGVHLGTLHTHGGYNGFNPGVYVSNDHGAAGVYYNSVRKVSFYATANVASLGPAEFHVGLVTGYGGGISPLVVAKLPITKNLKAVLLPPAPDGGGAALHFAWEF